MGTLMDDKRPNLMSIQREHPIIPVSWALAALMLVVTFGLLLAKVIG